MTAFIVVLLLSACDENQAKKAAASNAEIMAFCANNKLGCDFKARPPSPLNADEKKDAALAWVVTANKIHSFDDKGQPRFMPEGAMFVRVDKTCAVTSTNGSVPR